MNKYVNKTEDTLVEAKDPATKEYVELDNVLSFTLPDIEPGKEEIKGYSGMLGSIELPEWTNIGNLELAIKFSNIPDEGKYLLIPTGVSVKINWAESYANDQGNLDYDSYTVYASGFPTNVPGGEKKKGEKSENEYKISCRSYKLVKNSTCIVEYDPLNGKICFYGENYAEKIKNALRKN